MFNRSIFKQCLKGNGKLWAVFTGAALVFLVLIVCTFDASAFSAVAAATEGTAFEGMTSSMGSLLGMLETYYGKLALLLGLVYALLTAKGLVADEVDSGSMAYTLSTPIRRSTVVLTKAAYLVGAIALMFAIITGVGFAATELRWGAVSDTAITADVAAAAKSMDKDPQYVRTHLYLIEDDEQALKDAAEARDMDTDAYRVYLGLKMEENAYKAGAAQLTEDRFDEYKDVTGDDRPSDDEIEITADELRADPSLMLDDDDALRAAAEPLGLTFVEYRDRVRAEVSEGETDEAAADASGEDAASEEAPAMSATTAALLKNPSNLLQVAMSAAADALGTDVSSVSDNMLLMKDASALSAAAEATGVTEDQIATLVNQSLASTALANDDGTSFDAEAFAWMNVGCFLLVLAMSAISFFASCLFNRSGSAMALGGGLPFAFFLVSIIVEMGDSLENLKYLTITTLYDVSEIVVMGDFGVGLAALAAISLVLYAAGCAIFCKKDLPL